MNIGCVYSVSEDYISPEKPLLYFSKMPFGLASIATSLQQAGHQPGIFIVTPETEYHEMLGNYVRSCRPRIFCLTSVSTEYPFICKIAGIIRQLDPSIHILIGGYHATLNPDEVIQEGCIDALCIGEGEVAAVEYASQLDSGLIMPSRIDNLWMKNKNTKIVEKNPCAPFLEKLDALPYTNRDLWASWVAEKDRQQSVLIGRGCPNNCSYCINSALKHIAPGQYVRFRSPENIIDEIKSIVRSYPGLKNILLEAENLSINIPYTLSLCERLRELNSQLHAPICYGANLQPRRQILKYDTFFPILKAANVRFIKIGLESGSERIRHDILNRPTYANATIIDLCRLARRNGLNVNLFVMVGIPGETHADFKETIRCIRQCNPHHVYINIFHPHPGTELYARAEQMGLISDHTEKHHLIYRKAYLDLPQFSKGEIQREYLLFYYHVFKGRLPWYKIAARMVRECLFMYPTLNKVFRRVSTNKWIRYVNKKLATNPEYKFS